MNGPTKADRELAYELERTGDRNAIAYALAAERAKAIKRAVTELQAAAAEVRDNHGTASLAAKRIDARTVALRATS